MKKIHKDGNKYLITFTAGIIIVLGVLLIVISQYWGSTTVFEQLSENEKDILVTATYSVGQVLVSTGITSVLFEWFGYVKYAQQRLSEVLSEKAVLNVLTLERKKELKKDLMMDIYLGNSENQGANDLVALIDEQMDSILKDYYYDEYITYVDTTFEEIKGKRFIKKTIRRTFQVVPIVKGTQCQLNRLIQLYTVPCDYLGEKNPPLSIKSVRINGKLLGSDEYYVDSSEGRDADDDVNIENSIIYTKVHSLKLKNTKKLIFNDKIEVDLSYITLTPESDTSYSVTLDKPCKHFCMHYNLDFEKYELALRGNAFMVFGDKRKIRTVKTTNGTMIRFLTWALPGDGAVAVIKNQE